MAKVLNRAIAIAGEKIKVGTPVVTVVDQIIVSGAYQVSRAFGATLPTNGDKGYAVGCIFWKSSGGAAGATVYINEGTASSCTFNAVTSGAAGGISTWNQLYANGATMTVSGATLNWTLTHATNALLQLTSGGATAGALLTFSNAGSGNDVTGTSSTWSVTAAGAATFATLTVSGATLTLSAAETWTVVDNNSAALSIGSSGQTHIFDIVSTTNATGVSVTGKITGTYAQNTAGAFSITNNSATSVNVANITGSGVFTGTGASSFATITPSGLTTGTAFAVTAAGLTSGKGLVGTFNALTSGIALQLVTVAATMTTGAFISANDGAERFAVKADGATTIATGVASTVGLTMTGIQTSANLVDVSTNSVTASGNAILKVSGSGASASGSSALLVSRTGTPAAATSYLVNLDYSGATMTNNPITLNLLSGASTGATINVTSTAAAVTSGIVAITANSLTTGFTQVVGSTSAVLTSGGFLKYTWNPATYTGAGITTAGLVSISDSPTISTTVAGSHNDLNVTRTNTTAVAAITYTVSGSIVKIVNAAPTVGAGSTLTDSAIVLDVQQNNTAASTGVVAAFTQLAGAGAMNAVTITANSVTTSTGVLTLTANALTTGVAQLISATGLTSGSGLTITGSGATLTTGSLITGNMGAAVTGSVLSGSTTGIYTGAGLLQLTANSATTGTLAIITGNGLTTGIGLSIASTSTGMTSGSLLSVSSGTTGAVATNGIVSFVATGNFTSTANMGFVSILANTTTAGVVTHIAANALTTGVALSIDGTGVYTGTGFVEITQSGATTGTIYSITGAGLTTGKAIVATATAATLTTGRYFSANDGALEVFGVGANGHIVSNQTTAPTIVVTNQASITAAAIVAGSTDTVGSITTTGTSTGGTILTITFNKTYTTAPKSVVLTPANAAAAYSGVSLTTGAYISSITATTFVITIPNATGATPSWYYQVIA